MDLIHDSSHRTWYHLGVKFATLIPAYVLDSEMQTSDIVEKLASSEFADENQRMFPIDTPAATWLSAAYFAKNAEAYTLPMRALIGSRIKCAASIHGIAFDVNAITQAITTPAPEKRAEDDDSNYGFVQGDQKRYPMFDAAGVLKASAYFAENRHQYPAPMRKAIATSITAKAAEYGVSVDGCVRREAGQGIPRRDTMMAEILERSHLCKDAETSALLANINELVATASAEELHGALTKAAELLDTVDKAEGWDRSYGRRLLAPADFLYDIDVKVAEALMEDSVELGRNTFSVRKLASLQPSIFGDVLGEDFAARVKAADGTVDQQKLADELFSLPRPDKQALEQHLELLFA
jgi:hypothetical protein